jgi:PAS domain S-box-containing protein
MAKTRALGCARPALSPMCRDTKTKNDLLFQSMLTCAVRLAPVIDRKNRLSDFTFLDVNSAWEQFTGIKRTILIGRRMSKVFPGMEPQLLSVTGSVLKEKTGKIFEYYSLIFKRWFQTSVFISGPGECVMMFSDISEIRRGQKDLEESEEKFRSIIEQSGDGIVLIDEKGDIIEYNATMEKICGVKRDDAIGMKIWDMQYKLFTPDRLTRIGFEAYKQYFSLALKTGFAEWINKVFEVNAVREDGAAIVLQILVSLIRIGPKSIFVSFCRDVTSLRKAEKDLADQNRLLVEKNIALREVMAQLDIERKRMTEMVRSNMERLVLPIVSRIKLKTDKTIQKHLSLLEENLRDITAGFGITLSQGLTKLTQQEIEICDMIRQGLRCREIASLLSISVRTVETHRNNIRKKLNITDSHINLVTFLKNMEKTT